MTKVLEISEAEVHLEELIASHTLDDESILTINQKPRGAPDVHPTG